jgi:hypothetical protein
VAKLNAAWTSRSSLDQNRVVDFWGVKIDGIRLAGAFSRQIAHLTPPSRAK